MECKGILKVSNREMENLGFLEGLQMNNSRVLGQDEG
jgi:hypothetical protein